MLDRALPLSLLLSLVIAGCAGGPSAPDAPERSPVPEGINTSYLAPDLDPEKMVQRFEVESREIYTAREQIAAAVGAKPGDRVADVGAGTGLFVGLFSEAVGDAGQVLALDISPRLLDHMRERVEQEKLENVTVVHSGEDSTKLPANSVDTVFICDTYHHFEYHEAMLFSIRNSLRRGGSLIVIDFERIPGVTRDWILGHVRDGKEVFRAEIEAAGFRFEEEVDVAGLEENYFLRFTRP